MPWIYEKVSAPSGLVIEHDHQALMAEMDEITRVAADKTIEAGGRLTVLLRTFAAGMSKHLANEETYVPQMLRESGYTQEDEQALVGKVMQSLSPDLRCRVRRDSRRGAQASSAAPCCVMASAI